MSISGIGNYNNILLQWQGQQLKNTGSGSSKSSSANSLNSLFGNTSMTNQLSSMVELTKYAMDAMGLSNDSRVTFNQITKYREQLQNEFSASVKYGLAGIGIDDINGLSFSLDKNGKLTAASDDASDRKAAQAWLDANPALGKDLRKALTGLPQLYDLLPLSVVHRNTSVVVVYTFLFGHRQRQCGHPKPKKSNEQSNSALCSLLFRNIIYCSHVDCGQRATSASILYAASNLNLVVAFVFSHEYLTWNIHFPALSDYIGGTS